MKRSVLFLLLITLLFLTTPVFALEHLKKGDLEISVSGLKDSYRPGDKVNVKVTIEPKSDDVAKKMENRDWTFYNELDSPKDMEVTFVSKETYCPYTKSTSGEKLVFEGYEISSGYGVDKIEINVSGYVPQIESGVGEFTYLKIVPEDGDTIYFNLTVVNPSKLSGELNELKNRVNELEKEINDLGNYVSVEGLKDELNKIKTNLSLAEGYYNDKDYDKVCEKLSWIESAIKDLEGKIRKKWAEYYVDSAKDIMNDIDALLLKAESYIDVAKSAGKTQEVIQYELNLTQIKYTLNDLRNELNDVQDLYDKGKYNDTIDKAKDLIDKEKKIKLELGMIVTALKDVINPSVTPTPTKTPGFKFKLDERTLLFVGLGVVAIVGGIGGAVAISKWRQKRKWDELK